MWRWLPGLCLTLLALAYGTLALIVLPQTAFFCSDEGLKVIQAQSLIRQGWASIAIEYPGRLLDPAVQFFPIPEPVAFVRAGAVYFITPLLFSLLASLTYALTGYAGLYFIPIGGGLASLFLTYRLARISLEPTKATLTMLLLAIATPFSFYCLVFWEHTLATALFLLALVLLVTSSSTTRMWRLLAGGICLGAMASVRTEGYVFSLVVIAAWAGTYRRWPHLGLILLGLGAALAPLWLSNQILYGTPLGPQVPLLATMAGDSGQYAWLVSRLLIAQNVVTQGSANKYVDFGSAAALFVVCTVLAIPRLRRNRLAVGVSLAAMALLGVVNVLGAEQFVMRGLIPTCPLVGLMLVYAWVRGKSERSAERANEDFFVLTFLGSLVLITLSTPVDTGLHWGPRFLLPLLPLVALLTVRLLTAGPDAAWQQSPRDRRVVRLVGVTLVLLSVVIQVQGIRFLARKKIESAQLVTYFLDLPTRYVISEVDWFTSEAASLFYQRTFFYAADQAGYQDLVSRLYAQGADSFALLPLAQSQNDPQIDTDLYNVEPVQQFYFRIVPHE